MPLARLERTISVYQSDTRSITTLDSKDPIPSRYPSYPAHRVQYHSKSFPFVSFAKEGIVHVFIKSVLPWFSNIYNDRQLISLFTHIYFQPFLLNPFEGVKVSQNHRQVKRLSELANIQNTIKMGSTVSRYIWRSLRKSKKMVVL